MTIAPLNMLFSTDYELFFGSNDISEKEILIDTTDSLMRACENLEIPLTLFCDITSVWRYKDFNLNEYPELVKNQCIDAIKRGHDVQTHIHPHWLNAVFENDQWNYSTEDFLLGNLGKNDLECFEIVKECFTRAKNDFEDWIKPIAPDYECIAYRAGGYGLQPREKVLLRALKESGYLIDSSVNPGMKMMSDNNKIDFTNVVSKYNYYISEKSGLTNEDSEGIFEVPICSTKMPLSFFVYEFVKRKYSRILRKFNLIADEDLSWKKRGRGASSSKSKLLIKKSPLMSRLDKLNERWYTLNLNHRSDPEVFFKTAKYYLEKYPIDSRKPVFFAILTHSKTMTDQQLKYFEKFYKKMKRYFGDNLGVTHYRGVANHLRSPPQKSNR
ncbi:MAG: hypothetical protein H6621_04610 [Halobacteriovoraceae bacterium]|nr:hypothetical protein [Halobacteriovoraceae bacterium]